MILGLCGPVWGELMWAQIASAPTDRDIPLTIVLRRFSLHSAILSPALHGEALKGSLRL